MKGAMELRELRSFCTAARVRSISRAADILEIGQPTVTTHIKKLESELGTILFDRVKRPIQLTLSGKTLADLATPLVEGIDALADTAAEAEERGVWRSAAAADGGRPVVKIKERALLMSVSTSSAGPATSPSSQTEISALLLEGGGGRRAHRRCGARSPRNTRAFRWTPIIISRPRPGPSSPTVFPVP